MTKWHYLYEEDPRKAHELSDHLKKQALAMTYLKHKVCVLSRLDKATGGSHFYLSPALAPIAAQLGASSIADKPNHIEAGGVLFGDEPLSYWLD